MKRVISIQDISCVGKCSLTVALPVISAMGIETSILPTAVLSTHTMFKGFTFRDLTCDITPIVEHWKKEKFEFDAIYTGYLGSFEQLDLVDKFFTDFKRPGNLIFVDPVMADNGKLYPGFTPEFAQAMSKLCRQADVVVPNLTEAAFMLGEECHLAGYDEEYIKTTLKKLTALGAKCAVLTGVSFEEGKVGLMGYDSVKDEFFSYYHKRLNVSFHGTGDVFASTAVGALVRGKTLAEALKIAADNTVESIELTIADPEHENYGVRFERAIPKLLKTLGDC
ncbi:MAG: pyridoxamine kinase [Lentisphaeria bacterium]|nr:pyridoxamine kinase [Lentisphaeria bacterium]